jgi:hypothetical protein
MSNHAIPPPPPTHLYHEIDTRGEPSQVIVVETGGRSRNDSLSPSKTTHKNGNGMILKIVTLVISIACITAGVVVWATTAHDDIKSWASDKDSAMKREVLDETKERYVTGEAFMEIKTEQRVIKEKVDKIDNKIDDMHKLLIEGRKKPRND